MASYDNGDLVRVTGTFTNTSGTKINPAAVYFKIMTPEGTVTTYQYGVDGQVVRSATGIYYCDVDANEPGTWRYRWYSTGSGQAAAEGEFTVPESRFV